MLLCGVAGALYVAVTCNPNTTEYVIVEIGIFSYLFYVAGLINSEKRIIKKKNVKRD